MHVNPLVEAAATRTIIPHDFVDMALVHSTRMLCAIGDYSTQSYQPLTKHLKVTVVRAS